MSKTYQSVTACPLVWPEGWQRTPSHRRGDGSQFKSGNGYVAEEAVDA